MVYQPEGNFFDKYNSSNVIVKRLMHGFFSGMEKLLDTIEYKDVLEAGCGEGHIADFLYRRKNGVNIDAFDISENVICRAKEEYPYINFSTGSIYEIDCPDNTYDLVVASEVLEHLEEPERAIAELFRVTRSYVLVSVPREPLWRILNICRGKYLKDMGNTPGHIQHWGKGSFIKMAEKHGSGGIYQYPLPWMMALIKKDCE